ncbi:MAG: replicative DNA helicase [Termitinemataceae bacterium]|nr:MAG: replicative DNA helicase [Termitinemataceae bacterium]
MTELKDNIPPHNDDAEQATLGAMLLDAEGVSIAQQFLRAEDFYSTANGKIYQAIIDLYDDGGKKADYLTLSDRLEQKGELKSVGGKAYIASLTNVVPSSANIEEYAKIVQDCSFRRALLHISAEMNKKVYDISEDSGQLLEHAQKLIFELTDRKRTLKYRSTRETVKDAMAIIEEALKNKKTCTGIPSGFEELDTMTSGFKKAEMIVLGARPSIGKTTFALNVANYIATKTNYKVAFFTLEMSDVLISTRILAAIAQVDSQSMMKGFLSNAEKQRLVDAAGIMYDYPMQITDKSDMKLLDLRTLARQFRSKHDVDIIFIDYLGLITTDYRPNNRYEEITDISRSLKGLARELNIPVIVLAQLGRTAEKERPNLSSLRDSGAIEQDADVVMFLHKKERGDDVKAGDALDFVNVELIVAKNRNGPIGTVQLAFRPKFTQFLPLAKEQQ